MKTQKWLAESEEFMKQIKMGKPQDITISPHAVHVYPGGLVRVLVIGGTLDIRCLPTEKAEDTANKLRKYLATHKIAATYEAVEKIAKKIA